MQSSQSGEIIKEAGQRGRLVDMLLKLHRHTGIVCSISQEIVTDETNVDRRQIIMKRETVNKLKSVKNKVMT